MRFKTPKSNWLTQTKQVLEGILYLIPVTFFFVGSAFRERVLGKAYAQTHSVGLALFERVLLQVRAG